VKATVTAMYYRLCILEQDGQIGCTVVIFDCRDDDAAKHGLA